MNIHDLEKLATPGRLTADTDMVSIEDQAGQLLDNVGTEREWQAVGVCDGEGLAEIVLLCHPKNAALLAHCRNNFVRTLDALKVATNTLEALKHPQPGFRRLIAELEEV